MTNKKILVSEDPAYVLENLTRTLLYEGYSLYPYYRSAIKNQKPVPFGVIFPKDYHIHNKHSHSNMQSQVIIAGKSNLVVDISVLFLHLRKTELLQHSGHDDDYIPVFDLDINGNNYQSGWQTIERKIRTGDLRAAHLINNSKTIHFEFDKSYDSGVIFNQKNEAKAKQVVSVSQVNGKIKIEADAIKDKPGSFRLTVNVMNNTPVDNPETITRDEALLQSFISTHIILQAKQGEFISHQDPSEEWKACIAGCNNINTWPILIDRGHTTLLSSPVILYDYPEINPQSSGDLFDSTEIEEALLLHVNLLSDEEKKRVGSNDEKLQAMLNKVSNLTPADLTTYHAMMKNSVPCELNNNKI